MFASHPASADQRRWEASFYGVSGDTLYSEGALVWRPWEAQASEGWEVRVSAAAGTWTEPGTRRPIPKFESEVAAGREWRVSERTSVALLLGVHQRSEWFGDTDTTRFGLRTTFRYLFVPQPDLFVALFARASTVDARLSMTLTTGWTSESGLKLGPQLGLETGRNGTALRAGLSLTGLALAGGEVALAGGWARTDLGRQGGYLSVFFARPF